MPSSRRFFPSAMLPPLALAINATLGASVDHWSHSANVLRPLFVGLDA